MPSYTLKACAVRFQGVAARPLFVQVGIVDQLGCISPSGLSEGLLLQCVLFCFANVRFWACQVAE